MGIAGPDETPDAWMMLGLRLSDWELAQVGQF
jgi:hypothetical protein